MNSIYRLKYSKNLNDIDLSKFKKYCFNYVNYIFNSKSNVSSITKIRLNTIYTYIKNNNIINNNINNIKYIIIYIIKYININNKEYIYLNNNIKIGDVTLDKLYRLIEFGNLEVKKSAIFNEIFDYADKALFREKGLK